MVEQITHSPEVGLLPSQRYESLLQQHPELTVHVTALDQVTIEQGLSYKDSESLLAYSLWVEAPEKANTIAEFMNITPLRLQSHLDHVTENLEDVYDQFDTRREELEEADEPAEEARIPLMQTIFEKPVKAPSGRTRSFNLDYIDRKELLFTMIQELLPNREWYVFTESIAGKDDNEIAAGLGISRDRVVHLRSNVRRVVEENILTPLGFLHMRRNGRRSQEVMVIRGDSNWGVNILGMWYDTEEGMKAHDNSLKKFDRRTGRIHDEMRQQGLVPITLRVPSMNGKGGDLDYQWVASQAKQRGLVTYHNGVLYMQTTDIDGLLAELQPEVPSHYQYVVEIATDDKERRQLYNAIRRGAINAVKYRHLLRIDPDEAAAYLNLTDEEHDTLRGIAEDDADYRTLLRAIHTGEISFETLKQRRSKYVVSIKEAREYLQKSKRVQEFSIYAA